MTKYLLLLLIVFMFPVLAGAQTLVTGKITDALSHEPLEAAYVRVAGNEKIKTFTDQYGNFSINANRKNFMLKISYVGYKTDSICVSEKNNLDIELQPDIVNLKDIVVIQN